MTSDNDHHALGQWIKTVRTITRLVPERYQVLSLDRGFKLDLLCRTVVKLEGVRCGMPNPPSAQLVKCVSCIARIMTRCASMRYGP